MRYRHSTVNEDPKLQLKRFGCAGRLFNTRIIRSEKKVFVRVDTAIGNAESTVSGIASQSHILIVIALA